MSVAMTAARAVINPPINPPITPPRSRIGPTRVVILSASVGGGHLGPARELAGRLTASGAQATVVDLVALCPAGTGTAMRAAYHALVGNAPALWGRVFRASDAPERPVRALGPLVALASRPTAALITGCGGGPADVVVSTYPFGGHVVAAARCAGCPEVPLVSYVTDPGVHGLWLADGTHRYLAGWPVAATALRRLGASGVRSVDPLVRSEFRPAADPAARAAARSAWHLPAGPLALVLSGSWGVGDMAGTARDLARLPGVTPVVVCGRNRRLFHRLTGTPGAVVLGWVPDMASLMRACDVAVLNSGGLSLAEAESCGLPVIHYRPLPGQGVANAAAGARGGTAAWAHDEDGLARAIRQALGRGVGAPIHMHDAAAEVLEAAGRRYAGTPAPPRRHQGRPSPHRTTEGSART